MSPRASKRSSGGSRKKKLPEDSETVDGKKPKKAKTTKKVNVCVDETKGDEIGANSDNKKDTPQCSSNSEIKEFTQDQINWPQEDLQQLVARMEILLPEKDNMSFCTRLDKLNWEKIAFNEYTAEECRKTWNLVQKRIRKFRILSEVLKDAREWISKPWTNFYKAGKTKNHPEMPRRPLSTYMLFYVQKKDEIIAKNPGLEMTDVSKKLSELYKALPDEERARYEKMALEGRKEYERKKQEFYTNHPELANQPEKSKTPPETGPRKPLTPFMLFYKEQMKKAENADDPETKERCKALWENMSDKKKVVWINWAAEKETKYQEALKNYILQHPNYVAPTAKPVLTKKEKLIQERVAGKPLKPPNSAYSLYSTVMLRSEEIKNLNAKDRLAYISRQWKLCSDEEKQEYKERAEHLMEQYKLDFASYLESLPEDKRAEELKNNMPKRKAKDANNEDNKKAKQVDDDLLFKGEPKQPPLTAIALFKSKYNGKKPLKDAWKSLTDKERKKYANQVKKLKAKYISEFEVFLKGLTKDEIKAYKKHRKEVEERTAALETASSCDSSDVDSSDSSEN